jgi:hypothetical protein
VANEYTELLDAYEASEGYPTDAWIERFSGLPLTTITPVQAADFLVNRLPEIAKTISCMQVHVENGHSDFKVEPIKRVEYITGGWSGAEMLIGAMLGQFWIRHYHSLWKRGGYFEFEVPASALRQGQ